MTLEELDRLLTEWGALAKYEEAKLEAGNDFHVLQRARDFAPGTREKAAAQIVGRDGGERRRYMARDLGACGVRAVPKSYVDPVSGTPTRKATPPERVADSIPPRLKAVHAAATELYRVDRMGGIVLRQEYCAYGTQSAKAGRIKRKSGGKPIGVGVYRETLARAMGWMLARLTDRPEAA